MTKHTNPFYTIDEALHVLKSLGAKPTSNPFRYDESQIHWPEHILSAAINRVYDEHYNYYFEVSIHIDREGFDALTEMTGLSITRYPHSDEYDQLALHPGTLMKVFVLIDKEGTTS